MEYKVCYLVDKKLRIRVFVEGTMVCQRYMYYDSCGRVGWQFFQLTDRVDINW
jgi:hypothetical protein